MTDPRSRVPAVFVSHGAPTLLLEDVPARAFLRGLGQRLARPSAVLVVSAHWEAPRPVASEAERPQTIHDFHGFPAPLYEISYPCPGAPALARRAAALLADAGLDAGTDARRGLDHGAWVPLRLMYPDADVPATQLSVNPHADAAWHLRLGKALRPLRDAGVLVLGSGGLTHNLTEFRGRPTGAPAPAWVRAFADWVRDAVVDRRTGDLVDYRERAPHGVDNHPSEEHFLPFFVALGAARVDEPCERLHASVTHGVLAMDAYAFGALPSRPS